MLLVLEGNVEQHRNQEVPIKRTYGANIRKVEDFTSGAKGLVRSLHFEIIENEKPRSKSLELCDMLTNCPAVRTSSYYDIILIISMYIMNKNFKSEISSV